MSTIVGVIGYLTRDIVFRSEIDAMREDLTEGTITYAAGGTAVNVASWLISCGISCELIGMAGSDVVADSLISELGDFGVHLTLTRTGRSPVVISTIFGTGDRRLLVDNGGPFDQASFPPPRMPLDWIHVPGHALMRKDLSGQCLSWLHAAPSAACVSVDVCSASRLIDVGIGNFLDLLGSLNIDVAFMNKSEAAALGDRRTIQGIAPVVVIHNGPDPSNLWAERSWTVVDEGIDPGVVVRDNTGAGDAFAAGFIARYLRDGVPEAAVASGHTVAQLAVARISGNPLESTS